MEVADVTRVFGKTRPKDVVGVGKVKFYDNGPGKQFGFLTADGKDVFFHGSRASQIECTGADEPGIGEAALNADKTLMNPPRRGDQVVFVAESTERGLRALRWAKFDEEEFELILKQIEERPAYRAVERKGHRIQSSKLKTDGHGKRTIWEGKNLEVLRKNFPMSSPRYRVFDNDDGAFYFEQLNNDTWEQCDDPR